MAHELEIVNGLLLWHTNQMAYVGNLPWHGLGTKVEADLTPDQFQKVAGLDWDVEKQPLMTPNGTKFQTRKHLFELLTTLFLTLLVQVGILFKTQRRLNSSMSM